MTSADLALLVFTSVNALRVLAYLPQMATIARDNHGATAISYTTWGLFAASHLSTVAYAILSAADWKMAAIFLLNAACCLMILGLTFVQRRKYQSRCAKSGTDYSSLPLVPGESVRRRVLQ